MRRLRRALFWVHLAAGTLAGVVIFTMCVTGVLLAFQPQVLRFVERGVRTAPAASEPRMGAGTLLRLAAEASPGAAPTAVTLSSDPTGVRRRRVRPRAHALSGSVDGRRARLGRRGLARRSSRRLRTSTGGSPSPRRTGPPERRHRRREPPLLRPRALGPLHLVAAPARHPPGLERRPLSAGPLRKGARLQLAQRHRRLVRPAPPRPHGHRRWSSRIAGRAISSIGRSATSRLRRRTPGGRRGAAAPAGEPRKFTAEDAATLDGLWSVAAQKSPGWRAITLRLPEKREAPVTFSIEEGRFLNRFARSSLTLDPKTGEVTKWEPYAEAERRPAGALVDALPSHGRIARPARTDRRGPGLSRRLRARRDGDRPRPPTLPGLARAARGRGRRPKPTTRSNK